MTTKVFIVNWTMKIRNKLIINHHYLSISVHYWLSSSCKTKQRKQIVR